MSWETINEEVESLETERLSTDTLDYGYYVTTDGSTIDAIPQNHRQTGTYPELTEYTGESDIGPLLETLLVDELPPQGSELEATGTIRLGYGDFPGKLSNAPSYSGVVLPAHATIKGAKVSHYRTGTADGPIPMETPPTTLQTDTHGFVNPNDTSGTATMQPYIQVEDIEIVGDGSGGTAFYETNAVEWDWGFISRVATKGMIPFDIIGSGTDKPFIWSHCQFLNWGTKAELGRNHRVVNSTINGPMRLKYADLHHCLLHSSGEAVGTGIIEAQTDSTIAGCMFRKVGGTSGSGRGVTLAGTARMRDCRLFSSGDGGFADWILIGGSATGATVTGCTDESSGTNRSLTDQGTRSHIHDNNFANSVSPQGTRSQWNGTVEVSGAPSASNYDREDTGLTIIDTSTSPEDIYVVLQDTSIAGPL